MSNHSYAFLWDRLFGWSARGGEPEQSARRKEGSWSTALEESRLEFHRHAFVFHRLLHRSDQDAHVAPL